MHTLIFDIGKTNKKAFVFDESLQIVHEIGTQLPETTDEEGYPCENLALLKEWVLNKASELLADPRFDIRQINFAAYGASFVYLDEHFQEIAPLYNYLKPFPEKWMRQFYKSWGGESQMAIETASPVLGSLNSGLQLYRLKQEQPELFARVRYALHLPQYLSSLITGQAFSELTSVGCHTQLWDFTRNQYHEWVAAEGILPKLAPLVSSGHTMDCIWQGKALHAGVGLHDSSAALLPYLRQFREPFLLISTGTWCISLNPFNHSPLTRQELRRDCLCYLSYEGTPVKASRLFAGYEHEQVVKRLAEEYGASPDFYQLQNYDPALDADLSSGKTPATAEEAYQQFMLDLMRRQAASVRLALGSNPAKMICVDGGFAHNAMYMSLLRQHFPEMEVVAATVAQATALGAAMAL